MEDLDLKNKISEAVSKMTDWMALDSQVEVSEDREENGKVILVSIFVREGAKLLIGKGGQNLKSLEQVLKSMFLKGSIGYRNIVVDVNDYKRSKATQIIELARSVVARVRSTQKAETLQPMSPYERRIIHMELASYPDIITESIGSEPQRRIIVKPYL